jgi:predicted esterase
MKKAAQPLFKNWEDVMQDDRLENAVQMLRMGKVEDARALLELFLKEDRHHLKAWQLYAETWPQVSDRKRVWEYCLRFNPANQQALQALAALTADRTKSPPAGTTQDGLIPVSTKRSALSLWVFWGGIGVFVVSVLAGVFFVLSLRPKDPAGYRHTQPVEYYLYVPRGYSSERAWPLFIGIHGAGGSGLDCWSMWQSYADQEGFILLCPSIAGDPGGFLQSVGERTVWSAIAEVQRDYRIQPRMFLAGFSAGAFFVEGFAYHHPHAVSGLAILSSGYWIQGVQSPVPILVVIGDHDHPLSVRANEEFVAYMRQNGFEVQYEVLPGVGHTLTRKAKSLTIDLFRKTIGK